MALTIRPKVEKLFSWSKEWTAKIGKVEATGKTAGDAVINLAAMIEGFDTSVIRSTSDGAVWVASCELGSWGYRICRPDGEGGVIGGWTCGIGGKAETVAAMKRHIDEYEAGLRAVAS